MAVLTVLQAPSVLLRLVISKYSIDTHGECMLTSGQILEMSGIGDETVLSKADVALKHPLPGVGSNVQEHMLVWTAFGSSTTQGVRCTTDILQN